MPQLDPRPWFYSLLTVWAILLLLLLPTALKNKHPRPPTTLPPHKIAQNQKDTWKWH